MFKVPERHRIIRGPLASDKRYGNNGAFEIIRNPRTSMYVIASDGENWEHVSVHCVSDGVQRTPTWAEMCYIKNLFWDEEDCVVQFHPPKSEYVNNHKHTLHMWRSIDQVFPTPDMLLVGIPPTLDRK